MNKTNLKTVIIGTGMIAQVHFRSIKNAGGNVVGVVDTDFERAKTISQAWGVKAYENAEAAFSDENIDVIHVCTPNAFHYPLAKQALLAGKHVICEKPLAINSHEAEELVQLAKQSGKVAAVPFVYRYHPMVREAKALIDQGEIGQLELIHGSYLQDWLLGKNDNNWRVDAKLGGQSRAFADIGSHWCDLIEWVTGTRFVELTSNLHTVQKTRVSGSVETFTDKQVAEDSPRVAVTTEDIATVLLRTETGVPVCLTVSQVSAGRKNRLWFEIDGTEKSVEFDQELPEQLWVNSRDSKSLVVKDPTRGSDEQKRLAVLPAGHVQGYSHCFDAFVNDCYATISGESRIGLPTFEDGYRASKIIDAVLSAARNKKWVDI